jgi:hypothetical protein
MLNNITNFYNLIKTGKVKTQLDSTDLLPIGTKDLRFSGQYQPTMITYGDLVAGLVGGSNGQVLFNDNDTIAGAANLYWDKVNNRLTGGSTQTSAPWILQTSQNNYFDNTNLMFYSPGAWGGLLTMPPFGYYNTMLNGRIIGTDGGVGNAAIALGTVVANSSGANFNIAIGSSATVTGAKSLAVGYQAIVTTDNATAIGFGANTSTIYGFALGNANSLLQIGGNFTPLARVHIKGLGNTSATASLLVQNSSSTELFRVRDDGNAIVNNSLSVGGAVNTTGFNQKIRIIGQGDSALGIYRNQESTFAAKLEFMKSRGTYDVPLIVNSSDILGTIGFFGYNGTSYINAASISSVALSTSTGVEGDLRFTVWNNTGGNVNTMRATKDGVGIGNALDYLPSARLQIRSSGTTAATTALLVQNSAGNNALQITDDRIVKVYNGLDLSGWYMYANGTSNASVFGGTSWIWDTTGGGVHTFRTTGNIERFRITDNGNALIGTATDAGFKLDVNGTARVSGRMEIQNSSGLNIRTTVGAVSTAFRPSGTGAEIRTNDASVACMFFNQNGVVGFSQPVAFGNTVVSANSALVQIDSTTKGFLPPRMDSTQKNAISGPAAGLMIYDTTLNRPCFYNGTSWITL